MGNHKAGAIAALTMADRRIGLERRHRREPSSAVWLSETCPRLGPHAVDHALSVLAALDIPAEPADFGADRIFPDAWPDAHTGGGEDPPYVAILPGAGWDNKRYPARRWGEVAAALGDAGLESRVLPGPGEEGLAEEVAAASGGRARVVAAGGLEHLAAALRGARLALGGDTGPIHLAHALGTPVLCLLGPTDPDRNGPYGDPAGALWKRLPCSFCHQRFDEPKACMLEIPSDLVAARALEVAARHDGQKFGAS